MLPSAELYTFSDTLFRRRHKCSKIMKIVALVALAFALANSATTNIVKPWGYGRHGMLFPGAIQTPWYMPNIERQRDSNILFLGKSK